MMNLKSHKLNNPYFKIKHYMPKTFELETPHHETKHGKPKIPQIGHPIP
jgi:hypothetical protein